MIGPGVVPISESFGALAEAIEAYLGIALAYIRPVACLARYFHT